MKPVGRAIGGDSFQRNLLRDSAWARTLEAEATSSSLMSISVSGIKRMVLVRSATTVSKHSRRVSMRSSVSKSRSFGLMNFFAARSTFEGSDRSTLRTNTFFHVPSFGS
jgi:hypothetical protein